MLADPATDDPAAVPAGHADDPAAVPAGHADDEHDDHADHGEAAAKMVVPLCVTAALSLAVGLFDPAGLYSLAGQAASAVVGGGG